MTTKEQSKPSREHLIAALHEESIWADKEEAVWFSTAADFLRSDAAQIDELKEALLDVRDNGLIYWEPNTTRGHIQQALMIARIDRLIGER